ncbi:MAG: NrdH-redoxin [Candidatus Yanofskybacteria bacterium RIFCSPHIGHO2_01_FULL_39_8b]|uniref:NrdH-redoxin n=1 Tax=Candidatus Yanofskybacteria bacterium RIFCSPHIGHO2_01_FULL_39_8b TaxID=1802659 RepID=A0A1F8ED15_9BACT|nr:MAG: NrdH-redoxin [Candidatus Yanofskybacteria bacterium RIFCSPHIGHO2_01_FULL_39_8b]
MALIKIYTTPVCAYCKMAKEYFKSKNLQYEEIALVGNPEAQQLVMSKTGMVAAPIIEINGKFVVGFNRQEIDKILTTND